MIIFKSCITCHHVSLSFLRVKVFSSDIKLFDILFGSLFVNYVYFLHDPRIKYSEFISYVLLTYPRIWANDVEVSQHCLSDLCSWFDDVSISNVRVVDVALYSKDVIAAYFHNIVFLWGWLEHDDCSLFNDIVISKDNFEVLVLLFTDDGTGGVDDASLAEDDVSYDFIKTEIENIRLLHV